jgi:multiple sugar transport system substrate-binding protein
MKKALICGLAAALVFASIGAFARGGRPATGEESTLVFESRLWSPPNEQEFIISEILEPWGEENNVDVKFQVLDDDALLDRQEVQHSTGNITTDLVIAYVARFSEYVDNDYIIDLTSYVRRRRDRTIAPGVKAMATFDGRQYFVPIASDVYLLCANNKALDYLPAGADVQDLSWEEFAEWAKAIAEGEGEGKLAVTGVPEKSLIYQVGGIGLSYGAGFPDVSSAGAQKAWQIMIDMRNAFTPTVRTYESLVEPLKRGEAWLTWAHIANVGEIYSSNPAQYVIAPVPEGPEGNGSIAGTQGFAVIKGAPHEQLALDLIEYMTRPEIQLKMSRGSGGWIPSVLEAVELLGDSTQDEVIKKALDVMNNGNLAFIPPTFGGNWGKVKHVYDDIFQKLVLQDGKMDTAYLQEMQQKIESYKVK